ncbi:hybrid sensor histidine kinase/response regulator [Opitutus terrae]|nr:PAS domain-containing hybrid sensor histidine kinase/response regulator [Opitutus terrae]
MPSSASLPSARFFASLLAHVTDAVIATDHQLRVLYLNPAAEREYGVSAPEAVGQPVEVVYRNLWIHPADERQARADLQAVGFWRGENIHVRQDGSQIRVESTISRLRNAEGEEIGQLAVIRDISEKQREIDELSRQRGAFMRLAENSPDLIVRFDATGRMWYLNTATERVFGIPRLHMIGKTMAEVGAPSELCALWQQTLAGVVSTGRQAELELTIPRSNEQSDFSVICVPEFASDGRVETVLSIAHDVTDLKRAIEHAENRQSRLNLAVVAANLGVFEWSFKTGGIRLENTVAREILAQLADTTELPAAQFLDELVHPDDAVAFREHLAQVMVGLGTFNHLCRLQTKSAGGERWVEFAARCERAEGTTDVQLVGFVSDITERIEAAAALARARDTAEAASRAKDRFLATLSHELRTPLTPALMVAADLEHSPLIPLELRQDCATIRTNIELEARLIDDLLDVARIAQGKLHMAFEPCDAHQVLRRAVATTRADFEAKQLTVDWQLHAEQGHVQGDSIRLQQVFWNILRNAAKFSPKGGAVALRSASNGAVWRLEIVDRGIGIDAADLAKIFEAFVQASDGAQRRHDGLGLGLAISAFIVREHGGRIWAESGGRGQGATFVVELPLSERAAPARVQEEAALTFVPRRLQILVVEDHGPSRLAFVALLRRRGHHTVGADSVQQARAAAAARKFDLVISDLGLPDGSGLELMQALRREHGLKGIALSGYGMEADIKAALDAGFLLHLTKPVTLHKLEDAVARIAELLP